MPGAGAWQAERVGTDEVRDEVALTSLDQPLFDRAGASKRDLVDYLDAMRDRILPWLRDRPLSVVRARPGQSPFMQKNVPKTAPSWVRTVAQWAESSQRQVSYALCNDRRTLLWLANQRAVEYHPSLLRAAPDGPDGPDGPDLVVLDLDPPQGAGFAAAVHAARLVRQALSAAGLVGMVKTSGAKGLHVFVPVAASTGIDDAAAATRALAARAEQLDPQRVTTAFLREDRQGRVFIDPTRAGGATVVAAYSPRARPGVPVSLPVSWDDLDDVAPGDATIHNAAGLLAGSDPWAGTMPDPQQLGADLVEEGRRIPVPRVAAMHEGRRRARARRS